MRSLMSGERSIKHLLYDLDTLKAKMAVSDLVLFLDYDGTLVPFRNRPEDARPRPELKEILRILAEKFSVFIVSGRTVEDLKSMLSVDGLPIVGLSFVGLHGMEIESNGEYRLWNGAERLKALIEEMRTLIERNFADEVLLGALIEDKRFSLALHYRTFLGDEDELKKKFALVVGAYEEKVDVMHGAKVIEARPVGCNKGQAVKSILDKALASKNVYPIYIGDDTTDEDAFISLKDCGHTVLVAETRRETKAKFYLNNPEEVLQFLSWLIKK